MAKFTIQPAMDPDLEIDVSESLVDTPTEAVKELDSNEFDAEAEKVIIEADANHILVEGDGWGISEAGLEDFKRMGDSVKLDQPKTPNKHRDSIGQFGIAGCLTRYLGRRMDLESWHNDVHIRGYEDCDKNTGLVYTTHPNPENKHGTRILITKLNFSEQELQIKKLETALTWEMPATEDLEKGDSFETFLNGKRLVRKNPKPQLTFTYAKDFPEIGSVKMDVDYFTTSPKRAGIHVRVHKRTAIDPSVFPLRNTHLENKVFVVVNADGLNKRISLDRTGVQNNPVFHSLRTWIYANLKDVRRSVGTSRRERIVVPTKTDVQTSLENVGLIKPSSSPSTSSSAPTAKTSSSAPTPPTKTSNPKPLLARPSPVQARASRAQSSIAFTNSHTTRKGKYALQARLDPVSKELVFNVDHPLYSATENTNTFMMRAHILVGTTFALTEFAYLENNGDPNYVHDFNTLCSKLLETGDTIEEISLRTRQGQGVFTSSRRYTLGEISATHIPLPTLHELEKTGVVSVKGDAILGSELNDYLLKTAHHTPAMEILRDYGEGKISQTTGEKVTRARVGQIVDHAKDIIPRYAEHFPFFYDIGIKAPFILVENEHIPGFLGLYTQGVFRRTQDVMFQLDTHRDLVDPVLGNIQERDRYVDFNILCQMVGGKPQEVLKTVGYAQKRGKQIPQKPNEANPVFSLQHFKKAREAYLMEKEK